MIFRSEEIYNLYKSYFYNCVHIRLILGAVADLGAHLVLQQIFYGNMFTDTPLLDG